MTKQKPTPKAKMKVMITYYKALLLCIFCVPNHGVRDLYHDADGGFGKVLEFPQSNGRANARTFQWNLGDNFKMFGVQSQTAFVSISLRHIIT